MAIRDKAGNLRGKAGDKINRVLNNKNVVQTIPDYVHQTQETKKCSGEWGLVSTTGKVIRRAMSYVCEAYDNGITNRLNALIKESLTSGGKAILQRDLHDGDLRNFSGFEFNIKSPVSKAFKIQPLVSVDENYTILISLPAFSGQQSIVYPQSQSQVRCSLCFSITALSLRQEYYIRMGRREVDIKLKENAAAEWSFTPIIPAGCIVFVCMSLHYYTEDSLVGRRYLNGKDWSPAEILTAFHAGEGNTDDDSAGALEKEPLAGYRGNELLRNLGGTMDRRN